VFLIPLIMLLAFGCEFVDSALGMGYGTTLTPVLLMLGYEPLQIVPAILFSECVTGFVAAISHHEIGNVNLKPGTPAFKVALILAICSVLGVVIAVVGKTSGCCRRRPYDHTGSVDPSPDTPVARETLEDVSGRHRVQCELPPPVQHRDDCPTDCIPLGILSDAI